jgi:hypothetical protein
MEQNLKDALKLITEKCKQQSQRQYMDGKSLSQKIEIIKGEFLHYVDQETLWYSHNVRIKKNPNDSFREHPNYKLVELSERERRKSIEALQWLLRDVESCINHLENK